MALETQGFSDQEDIKRLRERWMGESTDGRRLRRKVHQEKGVALGGGVGERREGESRGKE